MHLLRFHDLKARGIVRNRMSLSRWQKNNGFPRPIQLGPNSVAWSEDEVNAWLAARMSKRDANAA